MNDRSNHRLHRRAFTAGQFLFELDDATGAPLWVASVSGGSLRGQMTRSAAGPTHGTSCQVANVEIEPIQVELGMSGAGPILDWLADSWSRRASRRGGRIIHADSHYRAAIAQQFEDALITKVTFPTLDASANEAALLSVELQPERVSLERICGGARIPPGRDRGRQKRWLTANFRLSLFDNWAGRGRSIDCSGVHRIDSFTIGQRVKQIHTGHHQFPQIEPVGLDHPDLTCAVSLARADDFLRWYDECLARGQRGANHEKCGVIEYLDPTCGHTLLQINLDRVGMQSLQLDKSEAGSEAVKRCTVKLYYEALSFGANPPA